MCAKDLIDEQLINVDEIDDDRKKSLAEHFMSMGFFHFRVKKYIEVRVADSVPIDKALGYVALLKGLVYSEDNLRRLDKMLSYITSLSELQEVVERIERDGFDAIVYDGRTAGDWADNLISLAAGALTVNDKRYLENVRIIRSDSEQAS